MICCLLPMARSCVLDLVMKEGKGVLDLDGIGEFGQHL